MSVRTIYTCERCKTEQEDERTFHTVGILTEQGTHDLTQTAYGNSKRIVNDKQMQVCTPCLEAMGISRWVPEISVSATPPPSIEDLIVEIVRNHVTEMTGAS